MDKHAQPCECRFPRSTSCPRPGSLRGVDVVTSCLLNPHRVVPTALARVPHAPSWVQLRNQPPEHLFLLSPPPPTHAQPWRCTFPRYVSELSVPALTCPHFPCRALRSSPPSHEPHEPSPPCPRFSFHQRIPLDFPRLPHRFLFTRIFALGGRGSRGGQSPECRPGVYCPRGVTTSTQAGIPAGLIRHGMCGG